MEKNEATDLIHPAIATVADAQQPSRAGADDGYQWVPYVYVGVRVYRDSKNGNLPGLKQILVKLEDAAGYSVGPASVSTVEMKQGRGRKSVLPGGSVGGVYWRCTNGEGSYYMGGHLSDLGAKYITRIDKTICAGWELQDRSAKDTGALAKDTKREQKHEAMKELLEPLRLQLSNCRDIRQRRMMIADITTILLS